ncbi:MAG: hypothetical protein ABSE84_04850, partial [Isosphaeraceae bacterium]
ACSASPGFPLSPGFTSGASSWFVCRSIAQTVRRPLALIVLDNSDRFLERVDQLECTSDAADQLERPGR